VVVLGGVVLAAPQHPAVAAERTVVFTGHGYGHGRGMGQYGSLGYAVDHGWSHSQILAHYYGATTLSGDAGDPTIDVEITRAAGKELVVTGPALTLNGTALNAAAVRLVRSGSSLQVYVGAGCAGPWTARQTVGSGAAVGTTATPTNAANFLQLCEDGTDRAYRGQLLATVNGSTQYTVNRVTMQGYLRGVVPRESPASWGDSGGGRGLQALMAQAVAARSYALAPRSGVRASGAQLCDTTACQVYLGATTVTDAGVRTSQEYVQTNTAISNTLGQVMRKPGGAVALTEFSSSTGGHTAGGAFPAVVDDGDAVAANPYHTWSASFTLADVAARLGTGAISSIVVTGRNGLGAEGGRVTAVEVVAVSGARSTFTGDQVRQLLGLRSNWFSLAVSGLTQQQAGALVGAVYQDMYGRAADAAGLAHWTGQVAEAGGVQPLVTRIQTTQEYREVRVAQVYRSVLGREPDAAGSASWSAFLRSGGTYAQLRARILGSAEAQRRFGAGGAWISGVYAAVLGRPASAAEQQLWVDRAAASGTTSAALRILTSAEGARVTLDGYYQQYLGRASDASGQLTFVPLLRSEKDEDVVLRLLRSAEYRTANGG
jgi:peptidoglycan hydrolase-like amidase